MPGFPFLLMENLNSLRAILLPQRVKFFNGSCG